MFVAPNWIGLGIFGLLGLVNPGFWLLGAGLEAAYLHMLVNSRRFRAVVDAEHRAAAAAHAAGGDRFRTAIESLSREDRERFERIRNRCRGIAGSPDSGMADTLARLLWTCIQLLTSRARVRALLEAAEDEERREGSLADQIARLDERIAATEAESALRRSLEGRREILAQRLQTVSDARNHAGVLDAELDRLEDQVRLLQDHSLLDDGGAALRADLSRVSAEISGATEWMRRERELGGLMATDEEEPDPAVLFES